jgi:phosphopentomutase
LKAPFARVILIVLDSVGIGELPDAAAYCDEGSNTLGNIAKQIPLKVPTLRSLGLGQVVALENQTGSDFSAFSGQKPARATAGGNQTGSEFRGAFGRMAEASPGKDSVTGHWEMMGIVLERPFPTFPTGFAPDLIRDFERRIGRDTLGNVVASGTEVIERLGAEHVRTGKPIVYTSADSVFQIAAHEDVIPIDEQYRICEIAFDMVGRGLGVGRVIARPFVGAPGSFKRTSNRHDYALTPPSDTLLDLLTRMETPVVTIGKVHDLFAGRGTGRAIHTSSDAEGMDRLEEAMRDTDEGLLFANIVDFDVLYGHRNDVNGYAANLEHFDARLARVLAILRDADLLIVSADHGNDPTTPSTDHSREYVPLLVSGHHVPAGTDIGTRATFADLGQTLAANFGTAALPHGTSFLEQIRVEHS